MRIAFLSLLATCTVAGQVMQWTRFETELTASRTYTNPVQETSVTAEFRSPSGKPYMIPAFWDGGAIWRMRFSPNETGEWTWKSNASNGDEGLHGRSGTFTCIAYTGSNPLYLHGALRVSKDGHRFEHADGTPFFWLGDTAWNGALLADTRDWDVFLRDRAQKGFNLIQFVTTRWSAAHGDAAGRVPYSGVESIDIDPVFFQRLDRRVDAINEHGHMAAPILLWAHPSRPTMNPGVQLPEDQAILLARYMVARYGAHQTVWMLNGDGNYTGENAAKWKRIGRATFENTHPDRLATMHSGRMRLMTDEFIDEPWFHFTGFQSGHRDDEEHLRWLTEGPPAKSWRRQRPIPEINLEPNYEAHRSRTAGATHVFTAYHMRRAAYWSLLAAPTAGLTYGAHGIWSWEHQEAEPLHHRGTGLAPAWQDAMKLPGSLDMQRVKEFFASLPWTALRPAQEALETQPGASDHSRFIAVSATDDTLVSYLPVGGGIRFRPSAVGGFTRARWFNPRTAEWTTASLAGAALQAPSTEDWLLVLDKGRERPRLVVLTDIGGDPDDQQSMIRLMTYSNEFDVEGLIASASGTPGELKQHVVRPDLIREIVRAYGEVRPNLIKHAPGYTTMDQLLGLIKSGNVMRGVDAIGADKDTEGSNHLIAVVDRADARPVNVTIWGGPTELAQALWRVKNDRSELELKQFLSKLRVHAIGHQDNSGPWIVENFPDLFYILSSADPNDVMGRPQSGIERRQSVYRGMYLGGDESLTSREWIDKHVRVNRGPLGALYPTKTWTAPNPHGVLKEGDTPSWFYFLPNGLSEPEHPEQGGWGGRFRLLRNRLYNDATDTFGDVTDRRATVWRWRPAFQNDFAARMEWCVQPDPKAANHAPTAALNGDQSLKVLALTVRSGEEVQLSAAGSRDGDGNRVRYRWYIYPEPGTHEGMVKLTGETSESAHFTAPRVNEPRTIHIVLEVSDDGAPSLTSYRRAIVTVQPSAAP